MSEVKEIEKRPEHKKLTARDLIGALISWFLLLTLAAFVVRLSIVWFLLVWDAVGWLLGVD